MEFEIAVTYTPELGDRAARRYCRDLLGWGGVPALIALVALAIYLFLVGDRSAPAVILETVTIIYLLVIVASYLTVVHRFRLGLKRMEDPQVYFRFGEENLHMESSMGTSTIKWKHFTKLRRTESVWLLFDSSSHWITFPPELLGRDLREFITAKIKANDVKVKG